MDNPVKPELESFKVKLETGGIVPSKKHSNLMLAQQVGMKVLFGFEFYPYLTLPVKLLINFR